MLFDLNGDYVLAWKLGVGMGLLAGAVQLAYALRGAVPPAPERPPPRPAAA